MNTGPGLQRFGKKTSDFEFAINFYQNVHLAALCAKNMNQKMYINWLEHYETGLNGQYMLFILFILRIYFSIFQNDR